MVMMTPQSSKETYLRLESLEAKLPIVAVSFWICGFGFGIIFSVLVIRLW